jgi:hypothetical protein
VDKDRIDASAGLAFSLTVFERYRKTGQLQAELHHVPRIRGRCMGYLDLIEGKVVACYLEDKQGRRHQVSKEMLIHLDSEKGPFEWSLKTTQTSSSYPTKPPYPVTHAPVPRRIAPLETEKLGGEWTPLQKMMLSAVYETIDGQRSVDAIKATVSLPPKIVDEALYILVCLRVITISLS